MDNLPALTFFCELEPEPLRRLFNQPGLIEQLQRLKAGVSLGLMDSSHERAGVVRQLNQAGIPVTAWLLLPKEQGYWFNLDNAGQAVDRYHQFCAWSELRGLSWAAVGLDIEIDIHKIQAVMSKRLRGIAMMLRTRASPERFARAAGIYRELLRQIRAGGYPVESYQFMVIQDERELHSQLAQRLLGIVDLPVDREVLMLYTSFFPALGAGLLASYVPRAGGIGLGSTGGGVTLPGMDAPAALSWPVFERDLLLAHQMGKPIYIFSLEGCVQQGFLQRLEHFDWQRPGRVPPGELRQVNAYRWLLRLLLRAYRLRSSMARIFSVRRT